MQFFIFGIIFSGSYHFINGIRYLLWSMGYGFELRHVYITGYIVIILSLITTSFIWLCL